MIAVHEPEPGTELAALMVQAATLRPEDTAAAAALAVRRAPGTAVPVVAGGVPVGLVGERQLVGPLTQRRNATAPVREFMDKVTALPLTAPLADAVALLQRPEIELLVITEDGRYRGVVGRAQLLAETSLHRAPPRLGGLATPIGVYLTDGVHRGGRGDLSLLLTGACIVVLWLVAQALAALVAALAAADPAAAWWSALGGPLGPAQVAWPAWLALAFFAVLLRLSPLASYHAAEHQAVHLVEHGLPLHANLAQQMPRVHIRCGTNLVVRLTALGTLLLALVGQLPWRALIPAGIALWQWRRLGGWAQLWVTTRAPQAAHSESGLAAARLVLASLERDPGRTASGLRRLWNRGLLQIMLGAGAAWGLVAVLTQPLWGAIIGG
ncbi:MAG TPA: hypothetical protein DCZ72_05070 [Armatimonadetes bacterium]|nr:hypothetical protein [Armatimonadota bacterium]